MADIIIRFIIGFSISLGLGTWLTPIFLNQIREDLFKKLNDRYEIPSYGSLDWLIGVLERGFFTIIVAFNVSGAAIAMISWIIVKMATNWHIIARSGKPLERGVALSLLLGSMISMSFALIGGLVATVG